jgi:hypothetical protein
MAKPYQGDDVDYFSAARDKEGNIDKKKAAPLVKAAAESADSIPRFPTKPKNRVVTKEELKKSGLTFVTFLNRERGLKRRVKKDSEGKTASGMSREARGVRDDSMSDKDRLRAQLDSAKESSQAGRYGTMKKGGMVKSSASKRADGIAKKGKTKGRMV